MTVDTNAIRGFYEAWASRDMDRLREAFDPDLLWHVPGRNQMTGDYRSDEFFTKLAPKVAEADRWDFEVHDITTSDDHAVALLRIHGEREGKTVDGAGAHVLHLSPEGKIKEGWGLLFDQAAMDDFWS
ncbi:MAG: nuclear transport factor 2 family protein [Actinomycetota bacterium]